MIDPNAVVTFAQYNEDLILKALFEGVENGFYVDVGANYAVVDSVTKIFYDAGWNGINIEPLPELYKELVKMRPKDINLECGISDKREVRTFFENIDKPGHSSFLSAKTNNTKVIERSISMRTMRDILEEYAKNKHVHFMKIDVEGFEQEVIKGNDWSVHRPEVLCIESNQSKQIWKKILQKNRYQWLIFDGLNEYYVAEEAMGRVDGFIERLINLDYHALKQHQYQSWKEDSVQLARLTKLNKQKEKTILDLVAQLKSKEESQRAVVRLSLYNMPFPSRLKKAAYGLSVDWIKYLSSKRK